jgi:hypothetical protein
MAYVNKYDRGGKCSVVGHKSEGEFSALAEARGFNIHEASRYENMHEHWDFALDRWEDKDDDLVYMTVDVKARKKTRRKDTQFNDEWIWLEFMNVQGRKGWLKGNATHIAFERENDFVLVPRKDLLDWAKKEIVSRHGTAPARAENARDARYKYYTRWKRQDVLSQVHMKDVIDGLENIEIWDKI